MYKKILSLQNLESAYLEVLQKLAVEGKSQAFKGLDGVYSSQTHVSSGVFLENIHREMREKTPLTPVLKLMIPKKLSHEKRQIYLYTFKDRIKAQAIYRVIEPSYDLKLSQNLYSYRKSHPHYLAAKKVARKYRQGFTDHLFWKADFTNYTENIDHHDLKRLLVKMDLDIMTQELLHLFIGNPVLDGNSVVKKTRGLVTGVPLIGFFANWYLAQMDEFISKKVHFYVRVGDDFILIDKNLRRINDAKRYILDTAKEKKLKIKKNKTLGGKLDKPFDFIGYRFFEGRIQVNAHSIRKAEHLWKNKLKYYPISASQKIRYLKSKFYRHDGLMADLIQFLRSYRLVSDHEQMKELSECFYKILTRYFFRTYSPQKQRKTKYLTDHLNIPSFYKLYVQFYFGKKTLAELAIQKNQGH